MSIRNYMVYGAWASAALALLWSLGAEAQQSEAGTQPRLDETQLAEITVTAEKRSESIQSAPAAITLVSGDDLATLGFQTVRDMTGLFPSARFEAAALSTHLYVRGIGAEQDRIAVDQLVNMSMDGVLLPREVDAVPEIDVHDVELLPGPQGTLYGASSVGGVLAIQNNRPTATPENRLLLEAGNYADFHVDDVVNMPVNEEFAVRGAVDYLRHSPYETTGAWTADTLTARLGLLYTPSDLFTAYIWGLVVNDDSVPQDLAGLSVNGGFIPSNNPWDIANSCITLACNGQGNRVNVGPNAQSAHNYIVAGQFDLHLNGFTLTDIPSVLDGQAYQSYYVSIFHNVYSAHNHQLTNELKIASDPGSSLQWLAGLYLYQNTASQTFMRANYVLPQYKQDSLAPYGQLTYSFSDRFRTTAGVRYSRTTKDGTFTLPHPLTETKATWSSADWKAGIEYDLNKTTMVYLTTQTGSSPGTLDAQDPINGRPSLTDLTRLYSLTGGWKSRLFDNRFQFNNEAFYYDYRNFLIQTVVCGADPCSILANEFFNAPKLVSWGDQLDLRWLITKADLVSIGTAYTNVHTGHWITDAGADLSNRTPFEAPKVTVTLSGQHSFDMQNGGSTVLRVDSNIVSSYWADFQTKPGTPAHLPSQYQPSFSVTDLTLTYHAPQDKWTFGLWSRNLENKAQLGPGAVLAIGPVGGVAPIPPPRTYGVRFTANIDPQ